MKGREETKKGSGWEEVEEVEEAKEIEEVIR